MDHTKSLKTRSSINYMQSQLSSCCMISGEVLISYGRTKFHIDNTTIQGLYNKVSKKLCDELKVKCSRVLVHRLQPTATN